MEVSPNERPQQDYRPPKSRTGQMAIILIAVAILVAGVWWLSSPEPEPEIDTVPVDTIAEPEKFEPEPKPEPIKPELEIATPEPEIEPEPIVEAPQLPTLDDSDKLVRETLQELNNDPLYLSWLSSDNLIRRGTAVTDGVTRGVLLQKFLPVKPPEGKFKFRKEGQRYWIDPANYSRYDALVTALTTIEPEKAVSTIRFLQPLFDQAFGEQGYKDRDFDSTLMAAIDQLLDAPIYEQPLELKLESVHFKFKDPAVESLPDAQKQLVRSGPENTRKVQRFLQKLRAELVN